MTAKGSEWAEDAGEAFLVTGATLAGGGSKRDYRGPDCAVRGGDGVIPAGRGERW